MSIHLKKEVQNTSSKKMIVLKGEVDKPQL